MTSKEVLDLMKEVGWRYSRFNICIPIPDNPTDSDIEIEVATLKELGYLACLQETAFGREIIITDVYAK